MDNMVDVTATRVIVENASSQGAYIRFIDEDGGDISNLEDAYFGCSFEVLAINSDGALMPVGFKENTAFATIAAFSPLVIPYLRDGRYLDFDAYFGGLEPGNYRFVTSMFISPDMDTPRSEKELSEYEEVLLSADFVVS